MRILISFDGLEAADETLNDLRNSGFPDEVEALLLMVQDTKAKPKASDWERKLSAKETCTISETFPNWNITTEIAAAWPAHTILRLAKSFSPDIIVLGETPKLSAEGKITIRPTLNSLLAEAECSVRIVKPNSCPEFQRILVGFDGSLGAIGAVESVAARKWPDGTEVRLLSVADRSVLESIGRFTPQMNDVAVETKFTSQWAETLAAISMEKLAGAGISASVKVRSGNARDIIIDEAKNWRAGNIFLGPHCSGERIECCLLGSVSAAVAAASSCSVEVVRSRTVLSERIKV